MLSAGVGKPITRSYLEVLHDYNFIFGHWNIDGDIFIMCPYSSPARRKDLHDEPHTGPWHLRFEVRFLNKDSLGWLSIYKILRKYAGFQGKRAELDEIIYLLEKKLSCGSKSPSIF